MAESKKSKKVRSLEEIEEEADTPSEVLVSEQNTPRGSTNEIDKAKNTEDSKNENEGSESSDDDNEKSSASSDEDYSRFRRCLNVFKNSSCRCLDREIFLEVFIPLISVVVTLAAIIVLFSFEDDIHEVYELEEQNEQKTFNQERYPLL